MSRIFLPLLVAALVALAGCTLTVDDFEAQAIELANATVEGQLANTIKPLLADVGACTVEEYQGVAANTQALISDAGYELEMPTGDAESTALVDAAQACNVQLNREVSEIEEGVEYQLSYAISVDDDCSYEEIQAAAADYGLVINANLESETATVTSGKLTDEAAAQVSDLQPAFGVTGNCTSPVLLAIGVLNDLLGGEEEAEEGAAEEEVEEEEAALACVVDSEWFSRMNHRILGNFYTQGDYKTVFLSGPPNRKYVVVGLDYLGGNDAFFAPGVSDTYNLDLIRWSVFTLQEDGSYTPENPTDVVDITNGNLRVLATEFNAGASSEGSALRRVIFNQVGFNIEGCTADVQVKHNVAGNFFTSGEYRQVTPIYNGTIQRALIGLDYDGGPDVKFAPGVAQGLIRWYEMSREGDSFTTNIDDGTVLIEGNTVKVKTTEFSEETSKEELPLRRMIGIYIVEPS